jgi:hypothetical protein
MSTTVTPSFTGSIAATLQGNDVRSYQLFGASLLPLLGRSDRDAIFISSSDGVLRYDTSSRFFDDSRRFPVENVGRISDDASKIIFAPNFELEETSLGVTRNFKNSPPYVDSGVLSASHLITEAPSYEFPVVLDHPNALDPLDMNGVIEPLTIRDIVTRSSLFLGNPLSPEPHTVKGSTSGQHVEASHGKHYSVSSYYRPLSEEKITAFKEHMGFDDDVLLYATPIYTSESSSSLEPFSESSDREKNLASVSDVSLSGYLAAIFTSGSDMLVPSHESKTLGCGFIYDNSQYGTDSIAFGGLLK